MPKPGEEELPKRKEKKRKGRMMTAATSMLTAQTMYSPDTKDPRK
jgi:hypothetical protein